jgi:hypothetical protein
MFLIVYLQTTTYLNQNCFMKFFCYDPKMSYCYLINKSLSADEELRKCSGITCCDTYDNCNIYIPPVDRSLFTTTSASTSQPTNASTSQPTTKATTNINYQGLTNVNA